MAWTIRPARDSEKPHPSSVCEVQEWVEPKREPAPKQKASKRK